MRAAFVARGVSDNALRALNYTPEIEAFRRRGESRDAVTLGDLVASMGDSYGKVFVRYDCAPGQGEELLSQSDMFAAEPEGRIIRGDAVPRVEDHRIARLDVLIAGAGTLGETELFGRSLLADDRLAGKIVGPDAIRLTLEEPESDLAAFCYAFLCTAQGVRAVRSTAYGTKILRFRDDLLRSLPIPVPDAATQRRVGDLIRVTVAGRERYLREVRAARRCVEELPEMQEAAATAAERKARALLWDGELTTMTAWNYGSPGGALGSLRKACRRRIGDIVADGGLFNGPHFARVGCAEPHGVVFCSQRDVFLIRPVPRHIAHPGIPDELLFVKPRALLIGSHGQTGDGGIFGRVAMVDESMRSYGYTQDILRVYPQERERETAYAYLTTEVGRRLLVSTAVGTSIPSMHIDLLRALPYPDLPASLHARVTAHVRAAMAARATASAAEQEAIRIVEEEVLPAWLA